MRLVFTLFTVCLSVVSFSQSYTESRTRHRFAQLNLGMEQRFYPASGSSFREHLLSDLHATNLIIGGTHFWGHADFFIALPLFQSRYTNFRPRVETGAKFFPWRIEQHKLRPFLGISWQPSDFVFQDGPQMVRHQSPILAGLVYQYQNVLLELGGTWIPSGTFNYPTAQNQIESVRTAPFRFSIGVKWTFDGTLGAEPDWQSGKTKILTDTLASLKRLNSWTIGVGPSSALYGSLSNHNSRLYPYLTEHRITNVFPEFNFGYYLHNLDLQIQATYRYITTSQSAFGHDQHARRSVPAVEAFAFLADYHGFVPFFGAALGYEFYKLEDQLPSGEHKIYRGESIQPALVFGWDIRPNRLQSFYLRTSLRYNPWSVLETEAGISFGFSQLEINFIQCVFLLNRW